MDANTISIVHTHKLYLLLVLTKWATILYGGGIHRKCMEWKVDRSPNRICWIWKMNKRRKSKLSFASTIPEKKLKGTPRFLQNFTTVTFQISSDSEWTANCKTFFTPKHVTYRVIINACFGNLKNHVRSLESIICVVSPSASFAMTDHWINLICGLPETRDRIKVKLAEWINSSPEPQVEVYNATYSCSSGEPIQQNPLNFVNR